MPETASTRATKEPEPTPAEKKVPSPQGINISQKRGSILSLLKMFLLFILFCLSVHLCLSVALQSLRLCNVTNLESVFVVFFVNFMSVCCAFITAHCILLIICIFFEVPAQIAQKRQEVTPQRPATIPQKVDREDIEPHVQPVPEQGIHNIGCQCFSR